MAPEAPRAGWRGGSTSPAGWKFCEKILLAQTCLADEQTAKIGHFKGDLPRMGDEPMAGHHPMQPLSQGDADSFIALRIMPWRGE